MLELKKYQDIDIELKKLEKQITASECYKKVNSSKELARKLQNRRIEINVESKKVAEEIDKIIQVKAKGLDLVKKYTEIDITKLDEKTVLEVSNKIKPIKKNLEELISRLNSLQNKMTQLLDEFENSKKQIMASKKVYDDNKVLLDELKQEKEPEIEKVRKQLASQEAKVNPELFQKYRNLKREGVFPVLVNLKDGKNCGYCRVEQSMHKLEKLKLNGYTECEQCHRIILNDNK